MTPRRSATRAAGPSGPAAPPKPPKPKLKKLRLLLILGGLGMLALVSTVFGMMMAVASDLPQLENRAEFHRAKNSEVIADGPTDDDPVLAKLTGNDNRILAEAKDISPNITNAVIAIEDRRFYEHEGVDYKGIARALVQDVMRRSAVQGGSTITQQFVKNALAAQADRSVFQKLREAALAYHLERQWSKQKVLTQYLNSVYFGNGAYGVEAAVRTYFGSDFEDDPAAIAAVDATAEEEDADDLDHRAAANVSPAEAALLAAMIASPSLYDPTQNPVRAMQRRNLVLDRMLDQGMITSSEYRDGVRQALPSDQDIDPPEPNSSQPYFTTWLTQQLVDRYGPGAVFGGGLKVRTTLDPDLQAAAEQAIGGRLAGVGPSASLVAIENKTGEVKAMVGGPDFESRPFNLATNGHRQPGSSFKPFILIRALEDGISPEATFTSQQKIFPVPNSKGEKFIVNNYEDSYTGVSSLRSATIRSDNSVYAELGLKVKTRRVARLAKRMGVKTHVSTNPAMTLGGLEEGLTPLELAFAYSTIANGGRRVSGSLASSKGGPVAIQSVEGGGRDDHNEKREERVFSESVGTTAQEMLGGVVSVGTGKAAQIGEFAAGKTGTTESYGDAWFVGFNKDLTVAIWVGYPDELRFMKTEYHGGPVAGGTYPAEIWHDLMSAWLGIRDLREAAKDDGDEDGSAVTVPTTPVDPEVPAVEEPAETDGAEPQAPPVEEEEPDPAQPDPEPDREPVPRTPAAPPAAPPSPPPAGGETQGGGAAPG